MSELTRPSGPTRAPSGTTPVQVELELMRRRFVEALRRAEIISLVAGATSVQELGRLITDELCEVYDAEIGLIAEIGVDDGRTIALLGANFEATECEEVLRAARSERAVAEAGTDLLGIGGRASAFASFTTAAGRQVVIGAARMYEQPFDEPEIGLLEAVTVSTGQALERLWFQEERERLLAEQQAIAFGTAKALANALEAKDGYTASHASEVADLALGVGRELGMSEDELADLRYGSIFHDIGKIAIPDAILNKPGPLTPEEQQEMRRHPEIGEQILAPVPFLSATVLEMVRHDHERWDGDGYPDGLSGEDIPLGARIILVVDSFHAMTSDRPYRSALSREEALAELDRCSGSQFDPHIVAAFRRAAG